MLRYLIVLALHVPLVHAESDLHWSAGTGLETRFQKEVNPDYSDVQILGQLFGQLNLGRWLAHAELGHEERDTSTGLLAIETRSLNIGAWGRYQFQTEQWRPFVGTGLGAYFDTVKTTFGASEDERSGNRPYWGLGGGISAVFWNSLLLEAEGRGTLIRDRREPTFAALFRVGFYY